MSTNSIFTVGKLSYNAMFVWVFVPSMKQIIVVNDTQKNERRRRELMLTIYNTMQ